MHHYESHGKTYLFVFFALCVLTLISVLADVVGKPKEAEHDIQPGVVAEGNPAKEQARVIAVAIIVLAVASAKALFVMMYFMHLKFEGNWKFLLLTPTLILAAAIPVALAPDIATHYYTVNTPQELAVPPDSPAVPHAERPAEAEH